MTGATALSPLDARIRIDKLPAAGCQFRMVATPQQLTEIAKIAKVTKVLGLSAFMQVSQENGGVRVTGRLEADVVQPCVVTLDPVLQKISEPLNRFFSSAPDIHADAGAGSENFIDLENDDLPDFFDGSELDLSAYIVETLGLSIELYPRAPGAEMSAEQRGDDPDSLSAFSALKALRSEK